MLDNLIRSIFSTGNPYLARLFDYWQQGKLKMRGYSMQAEWNPLTASAVAALPTSSIVIDAETDFLLLAMNFVAYPTTGDQTTPQNSPNMVLGLTEKTGANIFTDADHHVALWAGRTTGGNRSYVLPFPRRIVGSNTIRSTLTDNGGTATHCWLGFEGVRVEYIGVDRKEVFPSTRDD